MLIIRKAQVDAFEGAVRLEFENRMVSHARAYSPRLYQVIGENQMREAVQRGINEAIKYGFTRRGPIQFFLELMLLFGSGAANDPQYPWVEQLLTSGGAADQMRRAELLHREVHRYLRDVHGPNNRYVRHALERLAASNPRDVNFPPDAVEEGILVFLRWVHPEKYTHTNEVALVSLVREAIAKADHYSGRRDGHHAGLMAALMFSFGHSCDKDPLYPWIEKTLSLKPRTGALSSMNVLERKALVWLKAVLRNEGDRGHD
ncbi:hypothetical protein [Polyangium aurulentum]|uniref:hypothetical protein n=1 Tax=Polyangium aurulentum TaxID=2567896 RepID=UPI0010ADC4DB|nr:hypothetical protein [Polyangium aurulentum]UQA61367.1 hypothetical protein E8A73_013185 [Polyangium aurulentum]